VGRINRFYRRYHSLRYADGRLVLRLTTPVDGAALDRLREEFSDIVVPGGRIALSGPLPAEADDEEIAALPRLVIDFDRREFGRLRRLIDALNNV
jgi:hypothetical protein